MWNMFRKRKLHMSVSPVLLVNWDTEVKRLNECKQQFEARRDIRDSTEVVQRSLWTVAYVDDCSV